MKTIGDLGHERGEHSELVHLVLGLLRLGRRADESLERAGYGGKSLAEDDPVLLAALGAVSLRIRAERWLRMAASDTVAATEERGDPTVVPEDLRR